MINLRKKSLLLLLLVLSACQPQRAVHSVVPPSWSVNSDAEPVADPKMEKSVDQLLAVHADVLDQIGTNQGPWQLSGMIFELAVSVEGVLGMLMGEGEASVKTTWHKTSSLPKPHPTTPNHPQLSFSLQSMDSPESLQNHAEFLSQMAVATGRVRDPQRLQTNLMMKFNEFAQMGRLLNFSEIKEKGFKLVEFRNVLHITGEGDVVPGIALGGLLEFELRWKVPEKMKDEDNTQNLVSRRKPSLDVLLNNIVADLNYAEQEAGSTFEQKGFELDGFYIELGMKGEDDFGIARGAAQALGKLVFERGDDDDLASASTAKPVEDYDTINVITEAPAPVSLTYQASANFQRTERANRSLFRHGLKRAMKMGRFFAKRASLVGSKKWYIQEIEPEFELAVNGMVGLVNLEGSAALSLEFERKEK